jgi:hypothetical protein
LRLLRSFQLGGLCARVSSELLPGSGILLSLKNFRIQRKIQGFRKNVLIQEIFWV